ncbi:hypothetical protein Syun_025863 [Stephania yunnanensis]|uniref:Uncharacterized protein n=1 Tax=Stephania yunnanensis TaxID=152371 RepID=A0AAP0HRN7_9MAGN
MAADSGAATRPMAGRRCGSTSIAALGGARGSSGSNAGEQAAAPAREMVGSAAIAGECGDATQRGEMAAAAGAGGAGEDASSMARWRGFRSVDEIATTRWRT